MSKERKPGRRPGDPNLTKQQILDAARAEFGDSGFERATMRSIAARANVDPALIHHHFGTKQNLFAAAHELPFKPGDVIAAVSSVAPEAKPEVIVRTYLEVLGRPGSPAVSLLRAAATNESAARMLREFIGSMLLENADKLSRYPDADFRVAMLATHLVGVIFARHVLDIPVVSQAEVDRLVTILIPVADRYLNSPDLSVR